VGQIRFSNNHRRVGRGAAMMTRAQGAKCEYISVLVLLLEDI